MDLTKYSIKQLDELQHQLVQFDLLDQQFADKKPLGSLKGRFMKFMWTKNLVTGKKVVAKAEFQLEDGSTEIFNVFQIRNITWIDEE